MTIEEIHLCRQKQNIRQYGWIGERARRGNSGRLNNITGWLCRNRHRILCYRGTILWRLCVYVAFRFRAIVMEERMMMLVALCTRFLRRTIDRPMPVTQTVEAKVGFPDPAYAIDYRQFSELLTLIIEMRFRAELTRDGFGFWCSGVHLDTCRLGRGLHRFSWYLFRGNGKISFTPFKNLALFLQKFESIVEIW